jgi:hypothetical protein
VAFSCEPFFHDRPRRLRGPAFLRDHERAGDDGGQFREAVGDVARLVAVPLARDHERPITGELGLFTLEQPAPHVLRQVGGMPGVEPEHGLAARAVDVLPARPTRPDELPIERSGRNHDSPHTDLFFLCHRV